MTAKAISIGRRKTRLLCPDCNELKSIEAHSDEQLMCVLSCEHVRTLGLLPSALGAVSLEDVVNNTPDAARLFPYIREGVNEETVSEQVERERWG